MRGHRLTKSRHQQLVDWHTVWKTTMEECTGLGREAGTLKQWTVSEAETFLKDSDEKYVKEVLDRIKVTANDDILDIGCGPGRLTIPFAKIAKSVTAVDTSKGMLEVLNRRAKEEKLGNISCVNKFWREVEAGKDIKKKYDIVVASNSVNLLGAKEIRDGNKKRLDWDLVETLQKIDEIGKHCYITKPILRHNNFSAVYAALDKTYKPFPDYIVVHNVLRQISLEPEIDYFFTQCKKHNNPEKVFTRIEWLHDIKPEQKQIINEKIRCSIDKNDKGLQVWALLHWHRK